MRKLFLWFLTYTLLFSENFEEALELEQRGEYQKAMQIYKNLALKYLPTKSEPTQEEKSHFARIALDNYLGEEASFNPLGISSYKMNYILPLSHTNKDLSGSKNEVKFQISIKKPLFENVLGLNEKYYLAYTQTSWWQLYRHSSPFRETSYQPEFFVDFPLHLKNEHFNALRLGFLHESNGKNDDTHESRSWNRIYLSSALLYKHFLVVPRLWYRIKEKAKDDDNPAMVHYMGSFDLNLAYLGQDFFINTMLRNNLNFTRNKGAIQIDLGHDIFGNGIYWYVQYFNGYGDSLIDYNKRLERISTGFLISY